jgi:hypothetical protein
MSNVVDVRQMLYGDRKLPLNDRLYSELKPRAKVLLGRVPNTSPHQLLIAYILHYAQMLRADAGYGGSMSDGGASRMEDEVDVFISGVIECRLPESWEKYNTMLQQNNDPEYVEYLRLKKKFKHRP